LDNGRERETSQVTQIFNAARYQYSIVIYKTLSVYDPTPKLMM